MWRVWGNNEYNKACHKTRHSYGQGVECATGMTIWSIYSRKVYWGSGCADLPIKGIDGVGKWCLLGTGYVGVSGPCWKRNCRMGTMGWGLLKVGEFSRHTSMEGGNRDKGGRFRSMFEGMLGWEMLTLQHFSWRQIGMRQWQTISNWMGRQCRGILRFVGRYKIGSWSCWIYLENYVKVYYPVIAGEATTTFPRRAIWVTLANQVFFFS